MRVSAIYLLPRASERANAERPIIAFFKTSYPRYESRARTCPSRINLSARERERYRERERRGIHQSKSEPRVYCELAWLRESDLMPMSALLRLLRV